MFAEVGIDNSTGTVFHLTNVPEAADINLGDALTISSMLQKMIDIGFSYKFNTCHSNTVDLGEKTYATSATFGRVYQNTIYVFER